ncbi:MAG: CocE/NonD family hydrolase [Actinomycetota bacterium]|nr:CocE/NonD family hydrolase [Actinomycetota bacterium]
MTLVSEIIGRRMRLIAPQTTDVLREADLPVAMDDGTTLLADRWVARATAQRLQPTVLVRSPYGRSSFVGLLFGRLLAERGLQVVVQSARGTFGSGGEFMPFDERADGLATLRWLRAQSWHRDRIAMIGPSYLGFVQWALAADAGEDLAALAIQVSASQFHGQTYAGGGLSLENTATWMALLAVQESRAAPLAISRALRRLPALLSELPLGELDVKATGTEVSWFREAFSSSGREDRYWAARDFSGRVSEVSAPVQLVGGWYDILLPWMLDDFMALQAAGRHPQLTIGPWAHTSPVLAAVSHQDGIAWLRAHLLDDRRLLRRSAVRIKLSGERSGDGWRELPSWPAPGTGERRLWLGPAGRLSTQAPDQSAAQGTRYRYDPADPTPSVGGPVLLSRQPVVDNRELEARSDVVTYSTPPLDAAAEAIGPVRVELWVSADAVSFDIFARVCDVDGGGASWNVCDGLTRAGGDAGPRSARGPIPIVVTLWPMGHRFAAGHRIRLQVSSGAHPRYARNPGTGDDPATATGLRAAEIEIRHDREHPSALVLPS